MDTLFSEDPMFVRSQYIKLSDNVKEWPQEISDHVAQKLPKNMGLTPTVVFQKTDDERGYASGSAIVSGSGGTKNIGIPVIVKSWHLAPLDMFFQDQKCYPLSEDNIARMMFEVGIGSNLAPKVPPPKLTDDSFAEAHSPPQGGKYSYSSPYSFIRNLSGTIGAKDLAEFRDTVTKTAAVTLPAFHKRGTFDVLNKYAAEKASQDPQDIADAERADKTFTIKKDGINHYRLYASPDEVYDPVMVSTDRQGLKHWIEMRKATLCENGEDPMHELDRTGHYTLEAPKSPWGEDVEGAEYPASMGKHRNPWVFDPRADDKLVTTIDKFGRYGVRDSDGVLAKGWVIPNVVNFNGETAAVKLFIGGALSSIQGRISGIPLSDDADATIVPDSPDTGKLGTLVYQEGGRILATVPFQVVSVTVFNGSKGIGIIDYKGNRANLIFSSTVNGIVRVDATKKSDLGPLLGPKANFIVSSKMSFVRMPRLSAVSESPDDFKKLIAEKLDPSPIKVAMANGRYVFRGHKLNKYAGLERNGFRGGFSKIAFDFNSLARHEAEFLLRSWGIGQEKTAEILNGVKHKMLMEVHGAKLPPIPSMNKTASAYTEARRDVAAKVRIPMHQAIKVASALDTAQSVDTVLGLGFINEDNIERFSAMVPALTEICGTIAKMLLASRLGMTDIPEDAARQAMVSIQRLIEGLGDLRMMKEAPEKIAFVGRRPPVLAPVPSWFSV